MGNPAALAGRHTDSISDARTGNIDGQRDPRPAARSPSDRDARRGGDPYGQDHSR